MMQTALTTFPPSRDAALARLEQFVPDAGRTYAARRNYDLGPGRHTGVSGLSPYVRHRLITEEEITTAVLARHSFKTAEKFIQEVYWRTYWKGWLERRPSVWASYQADLRRALDDVQTQSGLRQRWQDACLGQTGIDCFDHWAQELVETGYLHNHARMWFASIWIFTLNLPWTLGADFFLRHLLDGDPASNTLSWRWVGGLQTQGKTYLARTSNISKYTESRFHPRHQLASEALPLPGPPHPPPAEPPTGDHFDPDAPSLLVLHEDDLCPAFVLDCGLAPAATVFVNTTARLSPLAPAPHISAFRTAAMQDTAQRHAPQLGAVSFGIEDPAEVTRLAKEVSATQIVTPYAPAGPAAAFLSEIPDLPVKRVLRAYDRAAWPHATAGFFKFKARIPSLLPPSGDARQGDLFDGKVA